MNVIKHFVNLTNGIEALPSLPSGYAYIRIQSTACEQKLWDSIIQELDYNFLMSLAQGNECVVYDYGARKDTPRSVYQGLVFIRYALERCWFGREAACIVRKCNCNKYFDHVYRNLGERTLKKLVYFRKFLATDAVHLRAITAATTHDGNHTYYAKILADAREA